MVAIQHLVWLLALSQVAVLVYSQTCQSTLICGQCPDCEGNFRGRDNVIPTFPRPTINDQPINPTANSLQFMGNDVQGCNEDQSQTFYYDDNCNLVDVPGDNIVYATGSNVQGRNLFGQNSVNWDTIEGHVINVTVQCQNQLRFCVLFGLGDGDVVPTSAGALCSDPPMIVNGMRTFSGNSVGDTATYSCNTGFELIGDSTTTCTQIDANTAEFPVPPLECRNMDSCLSSPCETGAMCVNLMGNNNYECLCPPGFEGSNCAQNINDCEGASCPVNSSCMDGVNSFECVCNPGFAGPNCDPNNSDSQGSDDNNAVIVTDSQASNSGLSSGVVAGVAVGGIAAVVFLLLLILVILLFLRRWHKHQKERFTAITSLRNHSSNGEHLYATYTPSGGIEMQEQPNVNSSALYGSLTDNPLYWEHTLDSTGDPRPPDSLTATLHRVDNPIYDSGTSSDQIYTELNPAYIPSSQETVQNGEQEPYAYAQTNKKEDSSPHYDYPSPSGTPPQDTGESYNKLDRGTNKEAQLSRLAENGQYDALYV